MGFDRKSWRLLGLAVGTAGLWWLLAGQPPPQSRPGPADSGPLVEALWNAQSDDLAAILKSGTSANRILDERNTRPLHVLLYGPACRQTDEVRVLDALDVLLAANAQVNAADGRGTTPLMLAAAGCSAAIVGRLLVAGADPNATNVMGLSAFEMTLARRAVGGQELARAGFRLRPREYQRYRAIYHDEPAILAHLELAAPELP